MSDFPNDDSREDDGPTIEASSELEEALREATQAVEARHPDHGVSDHVVPKRIAADHHAVHHAHPPTQRQGGSRRPILG